MSKVIVEFNDFARIADDMTDKAGLVVEKTIARIHETVDAEFAAPKHGATYERGGKEHVASAPGEPPAVDIGNLANSVQHTMTGDTEGEVDVGAEYGLDLELGTVNMAPRPFLGPAVERAWPEFVKAMESLGPQ